MKLFHHIHPIISHASAQKREVEIELYDLRLRLYPAPHHSSTFEWYSSVGVIPSVKEYEHGWIYVRFCKQGQQIT